MQFYKSKSAVLCGAGKGKLGVTTDMLLTGASDSHTHPLANPLTHPITYPFAHPRAHPCSDTHPHRGPQGAHLTLPSNYMQA